MYINEETNVKLFLKSLHIFCKTIIGIATILNNFNCLKLFEPHLKNKQSR